MGFSEKWIERVMSCVTTSSFSILINGKPYGNVLPSRGLYQGDPFLPYLFVCLFFFVFLFFLCAEGFMSLLAKVENDRRIHGVSTYRGAPKVSNLLFVDDSLLFYWTT